MSREIEYRAWLKEDKKMLHVCGIYWMINLENDCVEIAGVNGAERRSDGWVNGGYHEIEDVILMQYAGIKDKNGVKIYEGDWVTAFIETPPSYYNPDDNIHLIQGRVFFDVGCSMFGDNNYLGGDHFWGLEVIGNIHEDKELLND